VRILKIKVIMKKYLAFYGAVYYPSQERGIVIVEKRNPFEPEPMVIHNYRDCFIDKDFEKQIKLLNNKPKSKYHK
jgi:hypothetical protein